MADYKKNDFDFEELFTQEPLPEDLYSEEPDDWQEDPAEWMEEELTPPAPKGKKAAKKQPDYEEEDWEEEYYDEDEAEQLYLRRKKSRRRWRRFLAIWAVCLLLVGAVGCVVLYKYLESFEISRPEHVMDDLMAATTPEQWYEHALDGFDPQLSHFDDPEALFAEYYEAALADAGYTYRKDAAASEEDAPAYVVRAGAVELCRVTLKSVGDAGFGMHLWEAGDIETVFSLKSLQSMAVEIDAPRSDCVPQRRGAGRGVHRG